MAPPKKKTASTAGKSSKKTKNFMEAPVNKKLSAEEKIELYRTIVGIRRF